MHQQHITSYLDAVKEIAEKVNKEDICSLIKEIESLKRFGGRLFIIGVGGSAGVRERHNRSKVLQSVPKAAHKPRLQQ